MSASHPFFFMQVAHALQSGPSSTFNRRGERDFVREPRVRIHKHVSSPDGLSVHWIYLMIAFFVCLIWFDWWLNHWNECNLHLSSTIKMISLWFLDVLIYCYYCSLKENGSTVICSGSSISHLLKELRWAESIHPSVIFKSYFTQPPPSTGLFGYCSLPIIVTVFSQWTFHDCALCIRISLPRYVCALVWIKNCTLWVKWVEPKKQLFNCYQNQPTTLNLFSSLETPVNRRSIHFAPHSTCWAFILLRNLFVRFHDICLLSSHNMQRSKGNNNGNNTQII